MEIKQIAVLPGDGIGPVVIDCALKVLEQFKLPLSFQFGDIGWNFWCREGTPLPERTCRLISASQAILFGAITSKPDQRAEEELLPELRGKGLRYFSPIVRLRQQFELYFGLRPVKIWQNNSSRPKRKIIILRESCEDLYAGYEYQPPPVSLYQLILAGGRDGLNFRVPRNEIAVSLKIFSYSRQKRFLLKAFEFARSQKRKLTIVHKANIMRATDGLFLQIAGELQNEFAEVPCDYLNVDTAAMKIVSHPEELDLLACPNLYGDILSDLAAALGGGLGVVPSAIIGEQLGLFEPVHGSAPDLDPHLANPAAAMLSAAMLLEYLNFEAEAKEIESAVEKTIANRKFLTPDLGGKCTATEFTAAVINNLN